MKIVTKYILREFIPTFIMNFFFFFMMYMINHILVFIKPLIEKNVPFHLVFLLLVTIVPFYTMFTLPFSTLLATLMTMGRFSSDNEIVAFRALGFNFVTIFKPIFIFGFILMIIAFFINDRIKPYGLIKQFEIRRKISIIKPTLFFKSNTVKNYGNKIIFTENVKDKNITGLIILDKDRNNQKRILTSKKATFQPSKETKEILEIDMEKSMIQFENKERPIEFNYGYAGNIKYYIKFSDFDEIAGFPSSDIKNSVQLYEDVKKYRQSYNEEVNNREQEIKKNIELARESYQNIKNLTNSGYNVTENDLRTLENYFETINNLKKEKIYKTSLSLSLIDFYEKFALPIACLIFIIFAAPVGIFSKRSGYALGFIIGLFLCGFYWFFYSGTTIMGKKEVLSPFLAIFLPNILFFIIGIIFLIKRFRE